MAILQHVYTWNRKESGHYACECDCIPDKCPICHTNIVPIEHMGLVIDEESLQYFFQCPKSECRACFISDYYGSVTSTGGINWYYQKSEPMRPQQADVPETILPVSKQFIKVYNQALASDAMGLSELTGIGLRKALEYLIKDYAVYQSTRRLDKENDAREIKEIQDKIHNTFLGQCIKDYIDDDRIRSTAERAAWLGNDEAHYIKRWKRSVDDLKMLIAITLNWMDTVFRTEQFERDMPKP